MHNVQYPCNSEFIKLSRRIFYLYAVFQTSTSILLTITLTRMQKCLPVSSTKTKPSLRCRQASRWPLSSGGRDLGLSAAVSREALSSNLCVPLLAVRDGVWEGKPVGTRGALRDRFGDAVMGCSETYCGDTWRRRHDCRLYSFAFN